MGGNCVDWECRGKKKKKKRSHSDDSLFYSRQFVIATTKNILISISITVMTTIPQTSVCAL